MQNTRRVQTTAILSVLVAALSCACHVPHDTSQTATEGTESSAANESSTASQNFTVHRTPSSAPGWTVAFGEEFWRPRPQEKSGKNVTSADAQARDIDLGNAIERVTHRIHLRSEKERPGVEAASYAAEFDGQGLLFYPRDPREQESTTGSGSSVLKLRTRRVSLGENVLFQSKTALPRKSWSLVGNTLQSLLAEDHGLIEHWETSTEGTSLSWILREPPDLAGALRVVAEYQGLSYLSENLEGLHFADGDSKAIVRVSPAELVDAKDNRWRVETTVADGMLAWTVPEGIIASAAFPVVLNLVVVAEFGVDRLIYLGTPESQRNAAVATNGTNYLVTWEDSRSVNVGVTDLYATRVALDGQVLDPDGFPVASGTNHKVLPSVASNGSDYLVTWISHSEIPNIRATLVSQSGVVQNDFAIGHSSAGQNLTQTVTSNGQDFLVVWTDFNGLTGTDIHGRRFSAAGAALDAAEFAISAADGHQAFAAVASNGSDYMVVWRDHRDGNANIYGARVESTGVVLDPSGIPVSTAFDRQEFPAIASDGSDYFVAWQDRRAGSSANIYGARVTASGTVLDSDGVPISLATLDQTSPALAFNGSDYVAAWIDQRGGSSREVYGARITSLGQLEDSAGILIAQLAPASRPSVVSAGGDALVIWDELRAGTHNDVLGTLVSASGAVQDANGVPISTTLVAQFSPVVASNGNGYFLAWVDNRAGTNFDIYGVRISANGDLIDVEGIPIAATDSFETSPAVASNGVDYYITWTHLNLPADFDVFGMHIPNAGMPLASTAIASNSTYERNPAIASSGNGYLVVWDTDSFSASTSAIYGTRISDTGTVEDADPFPISQAGTRQSDPTVASNSSGYLVAWRDQRNSNNGDIYGTRVSLLGDVLDSPEIAIAIHGAGQGVPAAQSDGTSYLVVWPDNRQTGINAFGTRVSEDGVVLDPDNFHVGDGGRQVSIAESASGYFVAWDSVLDDPNGDLAGTAVFADGTTSLAVTISATPNRMESLPSTAFNASTGDHLIAYQAPGRIGVRFLAECGNSLVGAGEDCDDGGTDTPGCDIDCTTVLCGDKHVNIAAGETCDTGGLETAFCDIDCSSPRCGDGVLNQQAGEECDDANDDNTDACTELCRAALCGDGYTQIGVEECDDANTENGDFCNSDCDRDSDGDNISDADEVDDQDLGTAPTDTNSDGEPDYLDQDSDGDGALDLEEAGDTVLDTPPVDTDGDGTPDFRDRDSDGDGIDDASDNCRLDSNEGQRDRDHDGIGDACDDGYASDCGCSTSPPLPDLLSCLFVWLLLRSERRRRRLRSHTAAFPLALLLVVSASTGCGEPPRGLAQDAAPPSDGARQDASSPDQTPGFHIGGTLFDLEGENVIVSLNGSESLELSSDGYFEFSSSLGKGAPFEVTVLSHPRGPTQLCTVLHGSGLVDVQDIEYVEVSCAAGNRLIVHAFAIAGSGLTLSNIDGQTLTVDGDGVYEFTAPIARDSAFHVEVSVQPTGPTLECVIHGGTGVSDQPEEVNNIVVDCGTSELERIALSTQRPAWASLTMARLFPGCIVPSPIPELSPLNFATRNASFSRNGSTLFNWATGSVPYIHEVAIGRTGGTTTVLEDEAAVTTAPSVTTDGAHLVYEEWDPFPDRYLVARSLAGPTGPPVRLLPPDDGSRIVSGTTGTTTNGGAWGITSRVGNTFTRDVHYVPRAGTGWAQPIVVSPTPILYSSPAVFSKDGRWMVFDGRAEPGGIASLFAVDISGPVPGPAQQIYSGARVRDVEISGNSRWLIFRAGSSAYVADLAEASPVAVEFDQDVSLFRPKLSPTNGRCVYTKDFSLQFYFVDFEQPTPPVLLPEARPGFWNESGTIYFFDQDAPGGSQPFVIDDFSIPLNPIALPLGPLVRVGRRFEFVGNALVTSAATQGTGLDQLVAWDMSLLPTPPVEELTPPLVGANAEIPQENRFRTDECWFYTQCDQDSCELWSRADATGEVKRVPWFTDELDQILTTTRLVP